MIASTSIPVMLIEKFPLLSVLKIFMILESETTFKGSVNWGRKFGLVDSELDLRSKGQGFESRLI